jgi:CO/xanthine dehydrogenase Mo-binding subunit
MLYAQMAITSATARAITDAIHARIRRMPSRTNRVMRGSAATSELQASE